MAERIWGYFLIKTILITGPTGFIGFLDSIALAQMIILDYLFNSRDGVIDRLATHCSKRPVFIPG